MLSTSPLALASERAEQGHDRKEREGYKEVESAPGRLAEDPMRWRRQPGFVHQHDRRTSMAAVPVDEAFGVGSAAATQVGEDEFTRGSTFPDESVSLVASTRMSAYVAREAVGRRPTVGADLPSEACRTSVIVGREIRRGSSPRFRRRRKVTGGTRWCPPSLKLTRLPIHLKRG